jgi:two-component system, response regulator PdtaR
MTSEVGRKLAIVVDDEPFARLFAAQVFEDQGYLVLEAQDADEGLQLLGNHPEVSVLFTDISMPGQMDGIGLAKSVDRLRPDIRLVITSGRVEPLSGDLPARARFLAKPYTAHNLRETIRTVA